VFKSETSSPARWQLPQPSASDRLIAGVAGAVAAEIGVNAFVVRVMFLLFVAAGGWGVFLYVGLWGLMRLAGAGFDQDRSEPKGSSESTRMVGLFLVCFGLLLLFRALGGAFVDSVVWPLALFGAGVAVAHEQGLDFSRGADRLVGTGGDRSAFLVRAAGGAVLVVAGVILAVSLNFDFSTARDTLLVTGVVIAGIGLVLGPWVVGLVNDLTDERRARIRSEERAQVAAHLHDSVLQTLTLIQRRADDARVVTLARKQERELRSWLYGRRGGDGAASLRETLEQEMASVEDLHEIPIEVVVVGDTAVDEGLAAMIAAGREAAVNAAVHSGASVVDVFAEVSDTAVELFVRDTGIGFAIDDVPGDRRGVADSIVGRVENVGGTALVHSTPGEGTEVELRMKRVKP